MESPISLNIQRVLTLEAKGEKREAVLTIQSLEKHASKQKWVCVWSIDYLCSRGVAFGEDPLEALTNCIKIIEGFMAGTIKDGTNIWWKERGDDGGIATKFQLTKD